jgi:hypothetical protein
MIKLVPNNNELTPHDISILNATALTFLPNGAETNPDTLQWSMDNLQIKALGQNSTSLTASFIPHTDDGFLELTGMTIDGPDMQKPLKCNITPLSEAIILSKLPAPEDNTRQPQSQLCACSKLVQAIYSQENPQEPLGTPKVFFTKFDLDDYLANLAVTLQESILLFMESTNLLSIDMDFDGINTPHIMAPKIKRIFMFGPARNKLMLELHDGSHRDFSSITPSAQVEICSEILSIVPY